MSTNVEEFFEEIDITREQVQIPTPSPGVWASRYSFQQSKEYTDIAVTNEWIIVLEVNQTPLEFLEEGMKHRRARKKAFSSNTSAVYIRRKGRVRIGIPTDAVILKDGGQFGFAAYLHYQVTERRIFLEAISDMLAKNSEVKIHQVAEKIIRPKVENSLKPLFQAMSYTQIQDYSDVALRKEMKISMNSGSASLESIGLIADEVVFVKYKIVPPEEK